MERWRGSMCLLGIAALSAACDGQVSQGQAGTGGTAGTGAGGSGMAAGGTTGSGMAAGGQGAAVGTGGTSSSSGNGGSAGSGGLLPCGQDGTGVCISSAAPGCPIGFMLTQMGCDAGGGDPGSCCLPSGDSFSCGSSSCDTATQYCLVSAGGPCCESPSYTCIDLPQVCQTPGADCTCFEQADCPCGGSGPCVDPSIGTNCDTSSGGVTFMCAYP